MAEIKTFHAASNAFDQFLNRQAEVEFGDRFACIRFQQEKKRMLVLPNDRLVLFCNPAVKPGQFFRIARDHTFRSKWWIDFYDQRVGLNLTDYSFLEQAENHQGKHFAEG